jgi:uncharacterized protein (DUF2062 family)
MSLLPRIRAALKGAGLKSLWRAALHERATPRGIGSAVAVGVFVGCSPFVGAHAGIAFVAATLLRVNRLWAVVGSRVSFFLVLPWIVFAEIQSAHRLRTGEWAHLLSTNAVAGAKDWLLDWCLGALLVGSALALALGGVAYALAARRERLTPRTLAESPPPTSGSPR